MTKKYQNIEFDASTLAVPDQVRVVMDEIAADLREGLLALAVGAGTGGDDPADGGRCECGVWAARPA